MAHVVVTIDYKGKKVDLALPMHVPSHQLVEGILQVLQVSRQGRQVWSLAVMGDGEVRRIPGHMNLGEAEVLHGMVLTLLGEEGPILPRAGAYLRSSKGKVFPLKTRRVVLGRNDPHSGIVVDIDLTTVADEPQAISRNHACIEQEGEYFYLTDLGSRNGTRLNGRELLPHERERLQDGDTIELGRGAARLVFCLRTEERPSPDSW